LGPELPQPPVQELLVSTVTKAQLTHDRQTDSPVPVGFSCRVPRGGLQGAPACSLQWWRHEQPVSHLRVTSLPRARHPLWLV